MRIGRSICILLMGLIPFCQQSFAGTRAPVSLHGDIQQIFFSTSPSIRAFRHSLEESSDHLFHCELASSFVEQSHFKNTFKYKRKKYKRVFSSLSLRAPVREVEVLPLNIHVSESYSKPHFLSPLHRYLFMLTPF